MNLQCIDVSKCQRTEKVVSEGLCLSYDLLSGVCLETMSRCVALTDETGSAEQG